jgi:hypothetical protein
MDLGTSSINPFSSSARNGGKLGGHLHSLVRNKNKKSLREVFEFLRLGPKASPSFYEQRGKEEEK